MRHFLRLGLAAAASAAIVALPAASASAATRFTGSAPGSVTCTMHLNLRFSPALTTHGGGTNTRVMGTATGCIASQAGITFKRTQKIQVNGGSPFGINPGFCGTAASAGGTFSVQWKGGFTGTYNGANFVGTATFNKSDISTAGATLDTSSGFVGIDLVPASSGSVVSGSFNPQPPGGAGNVSGSLKSLVTPAALHSECTGKGVKILKMSGPLTVS